MRIIILTREIHKSGSWITDLVNALHNSTTNYAYSTPLLIDVISVDCGKNNDDDVTNVVIIVGTRLYHRRHRQTTTYSLIEYPTLPLPSPLRGHYQYSRYLNYTTYQLLTAPSVLSLVVINGYIIEYSKRQSV